MRAAALSCFAVMVLAFPAGSSAQAGSVGSPGRYVIVHSPHIQSDTVLLDTVTGKTWAQRQDNSREGAPTFWVPMAREDNPAEMDKLLRDYPPKK
jgi:hypothetical protein